MRIYKQKKRTTRDENTENSNHRYSGQRNKKTNCEHWLELSTSIEALGLNLVPFTTNVLRVNCYSFARPTSYIYPCSWLVLQTRTQLIVNQPANSSKTLLVLSRLRQNFVNRFISFDSCYSCTSAIFFFSRHLYIKVRFLPLVFQQNSFKKPESIR